MIKCYSELILLPTYEERVTYLKTDSIIGVSTLGGHRYIYEQFLLTKEWKHIRDQIILRDLGRDLALEGYDIFDRKTIQIHHIEPITREDVIEHTPKLVDLENLVCVSGATHKLIHYGGDIRDPNKLIERTPFDTCPWKSMKGQ